MENIISVIFLGPKKCKFLVITKKNHVVCRNHADTPNKLVFITAFYLKSLKLRKDLMSKKGHFFPKC